MTSNEGIIIADSFIKAGDIISIEGDFVTGIFAAHSQTNKDKIHIGIAARNIEKDESVNFDPLDNTCDVIISHGGIKRSDNEEVVIKYYDIQLFNFDNNSWKLLKCEDLPLYDLEQDMRNIASVEDDPLRIVKIEEILCIDRARKDKITIKQVGKMLNVEDLSKEDIARIEQL